MSIAGQVAIEGGLERIPSTMQAAVYRGVNDVRVETVPVPRLARGISGPGPHLRNLRHGPEEDLYRISFRSHGFLGMRPPGMVAAVGQGVTASRWATG